MYGDESCRSPLKMQGRQGQLAPWPLGGILPWVCTNEAGGKKKE